MYFVLIVRFGQVRPCTHVSVCLCGYVVYVYVYVYVVFVSVCERVLACLLEVSKKSNDSRLPVLAGYTGARCEVALTGCQSLPCQHGATCQSGNGTGTFLCLCSTGFTGKHQLYCQSGTGTDTDTFLCLFPTGFTGKRWHYCLEVSVV